MIYAQSRVSGFLKTADSPSDIVSVTQCLSSMSKPLTGPPPADGRSQDVGVKVDDCSSSSFVKVQAPASPRTCSVSVPSETKSNQPAVSHSSKEGTELWRWFRIYLLRSLQMKRFFYNDAFYSFSNRSLLLSCEWQLLINEYDDDDDDGECAFCIFLLKGRKRHSLQNVANGTS